jgi:hypothetical protein
MPLSQSMSPPNALPGLRGYPADFAEIAKKTQPKQSAARRLAAMPSDQRISTRSNRLHYNHTAINGNQADEAVVRLCVTRCP